MEADEQSLREEEAALDRTKKEGEADKEGLPGRHKSQPRGTARAKDAGSAGIAGKDADAADGKVIGSGMDVVMRPSGRKGRVLRKAQGDRWLVETGSLRLAVAEKDLAPARDEGKPLPAFDLELAPADSGAQFKAVFELDVRGFRLQEALDAVERQVDAAGLQGLQLFSIVHGTGEGILGRGIHDWLKRSPVVDDYHFARPEEGGYGKTVVRLKG
jgi:DNA mismatch repair protein MutS2